jgi:hypothetical protein
MEYCEIALTKLGFKLLPLYQRAEALNISIYRARKLRIDYEEKGLIRKFGNGYYLTEEGLKVLREVVYATAKRKFEESNTSEYKSAN